MFIQVIDFRTDQFEQIRALVDDYRASTEGKRTARRAIVAKSRDEDDRYLNIVFFDSYEEAMRNSELPETSAFAEKMMALGKGEPTFHNLDVVVDEAY